jgi:carbamoyltransferase
MDYKKIFLKDLINKELKTIENIKKNYNIFFSEHHMSHAASAFYPSPFKNSAILTLDGVGEWDTSTIGIGFDNKIELLEKIHYPHSLGLLYSAFTYYLGFKVNEDEYKVMGLAPYGQPVYSEFIFKELIDLKDDGSFRLNQKYFNYTTGFTMTNNHFSEIFGHNKEKKK